MANQSPLGVELEMAAHTHLEWFPPPAHLSSEAPGALDLNDEVFFNYDASAFQTPGDLYTSIPEGQGPLLLTLLLANTQFAALLLALLTPDMNPAAHFKHDLHPGYAQSHPSRGVAHSYGALMADGLAPSKLGGSFDSSLASSGTEYFTSGPAADPTTNTGASGPALDTLGSRMMYNPGAPLESPTNTDLVSQAVAYGSDLSSMIGMGSSALSSGAMSPGAATPGITPGITPGVTPGLFSASSGLTQEPVHMSSINTFPASNSPQLGQAVMPSAMDPASLAAAVAGAAAATPHSLSGQSHFFSTGPAQMPGRPVRRFSLAVEQLDRMSLQPGLPLLPAQARFDDVQERTINPQQLLGAPPLLRYILPSLVLSPQLLTFFRLSVPVPELSDGLAYVMNDECVSAITYWLNSSLDGLAEKHVRNGVKNPTGVLKPQWTRRNLIQVLDEKARRRRRKSATSPEKPPALEVPAEEEPPEMAVEPAAAEVAPMHAPAAADDDLDDDEPKPFPCPDCEKQFKRLEHLKRHIRSVHLNIRPFHCKYCDKKFSRLDNLAQHLKTHFKVNANGTTTVVYGNPNPHNRGGRKKSFGADDVA